MGKVTIIIESKNITTQLLEAKCHELFNEEAGWYLGNIPEDIEVFIIPSDEEESNVLP